MLLMMMSFTLAQTPEDVQYRVTNYNKETLTLVGEDNAPFQVKTQDIQLAVLSVDGSTYLISLSADEEVFVLLDQPCHFAKQRIMELGRYGIKTRTEDAAGVAFNLSCEALQLPPEVAIRENLIVEMKKQWTGVPLSTLQVVRAKGADEGEVSASLQNLRVLLGPCFSQSTVDSPSITVKVKNKGEAGTVKLLSGTGHHAVDQCVVDVLEGGASMASTMKSAVLEIGPEPEN